MRVVAALLLSASLAGCAPGRGIVEVTVDSESPITGIGRLAVDVINNGQMAHTDFNLTPAITVPPTHKFSLGFDPDRKGVITVIVEAFDEKNKSIAKGRNDADVEPSLGTSMLVKLTSDVTRVDMAVGDGNHSDMMVDAVFDIAIPIDMTFVCTSDNDCGNGKPPKCNGFTGRCVNCIATDADAGTMNTCPQGQFCTQVNGVLQCAKGCAGDGECTTDGGVKQVCCNHLCTETANDNANCGACGKICPGQTASCCNSLCVDAMSDIKNCGACNKVCGPVANSTPSCSMMACVPTCQMGYKDCNAMYMDGCEVNTTNDVNNCMACGNKCAPVTNGVQACVSSACVIASCNGSFKDCDGAYNNGCEVDTATDVNNCKTCSNKCPAVPNGVAGCAQSKCGIASCNGAFKDCDNNLVNGCEVDTATSLANCGGCGKACPAITNGTGACSMGGCVIQKCTDPFQDCDANIANGCEANVQTDVNNCGMCKKQCQPAAHSTPSCAAGLCKAVCAANYADCNGNYNDGCEIDTTNDIANCGGCGKQCPFGWRCGASKCVQDNVLVIGTSGTNIDNVTGTLRAVSSDQNNKTFGTVDSCNYKKTNPPCTPTLNLFQSYDAVLVFADGNFENPGTLGDLLASYWDGGGRVVVAPLANANQPIGGNFGDPQKGYLFIDPTVGQDLDIKDSLGVVKEPQSSLLTDVGALGFTGNRSGGGVINNGVVVAFWSNNLNMGMGNPSPLIVRGVVKGRNRVDINLYPVSTSWTGKGAELLRNALIYK